MEKQNCGVI